tara:strand:+ start:159 stop:374 length:216 start_codon:yes stop_codon:yes gene_type:complete
LIFLERVYSGWRQKKRIPAEEEDSSRRRGSQQKKRIPAEEEDFSKRRGFQQKKRIPAEASQNSTSGDIVTD